MGLPIRENSRHLAAFETYFAIGEGRSHAEVARRIGVHVGSVDNWSRAFGWEKRIAERDKEIAAIVAKGAVEDEAKSRKLQLQVARSVQARVALGLQSGAIQPSVQDFVASAKHELLILGKATERTEQLGGPAFDAMIDRISQVIEAAVPVLCSHCKAELGIRARLSEGLAGAAAELGGGNA